jgi:hypothetical protein
LPGVTLHVFSRAKIVEGAQGADFKLGHGGLLQVIQ